MKVEQIYELTNSVAKEVVGETAVLEKDLSNIVDIGEQILNATDVDNYVKQLTNRIGKTIFVNRVYEGSAPSVMMDGWEYGSILQKIKAEMPEATDNPAWELVNGNSYDYNTFYQPDVSDKFFNSKVSFQVNVSYTEMQVKESFTSAEQLNGFLSMLTNEVDKAITIRMNSLVRLTVNNYIADTMYDAYGASPVAGQSSIRAVNLLKLYQDEVDSTLTDPKECLTNPEFIRFSVMKMKMYISRLRDASKLFNIGKNVRFTPSDLLHVIMLNEFRTAADVYLQADTYNQEFTALPNAETVTFWDGPGLDYGFDSTSKIHVSTKLSQSPIEASGILGVMFDRDALGVLNVNPRVRTADNPQGEFHTNFHKVDAQYFNDHDENFVVFYVQ